MDWGHVLERSWLHLGFAPWVIGLTTYGFWLLGRYRPHLALTGWWRYIVPLLASALTIFVREPMDVAAGGTVAKSYIDLAVWGVSLGLAAYGLKWYAKHFPIE